MGVHFCEADVRVRVDGRLLVDLPHALDVADVERVLAKQEARVEGLDFPAELFFLLRLLEGCDLALGQKGAGVGRSLLEPAQSVLRTEHTVSAPNASDSERRD